MTRPSTRSTPRPDTERFAVVYECPDCEQRYLDERRCPDCNLFCRRLDHGGPCPHCGEVVALEELAATPRLPSNQQEATTTY